MCGAPCSPGSRRGSIRGQTAESTQARMNTVYLALLHVRTQPLTFDPACPHWQAPRGIVCSSATSPARDLTGETLRWMATKPPTPGTSPELSTSDSLTECRDSALSDGNLSSLSTNASTADINDFDAAHGS
ncbi:hypothetical protein N657DRAFT_667004, partial [Parathielavia appendiculata]